MQNHRHRPTRLRQSGSRPRGGIVALVSALLAISLLAGCKTAKHVGGAVSKAQSVVKPVQSVIRPVESAVNAVNDLQSPRTIIKGAGYLVEVLKKDPPFNPLVSKGAHNMGVYSVETPIAWARLEGDPERWTVDGGDSESLFYFKSIESGQRLFPKAKNKEDRHYKKKDIEPYMDGMLRAEITALFVETFGIVHQAKDLRLDDVTSSSFGPWDGFSFSFGYETEDAVSMRGRGLGVVINGFLELIVYVGTEDQSFEERKHSVEHIFRSIDRPFEEPEEPETEESSSS